MCHPTQPSRNRGARRDSVIAAAFNLPQRRREVERDQEAREAHVWKTIGRDCRGNRFGDENFGEKAWACKRDRVIR